MFIFGYGSLMWDGWENDFGCISKGKAGLKGHRRKFNKASVSNWGNKETPGPTLNIEQDESSVCEGMAFEFPENDKEKVLEYLKKREGKAFLLKEYTVILDNGNEVKAFTPIYEGKNILNETLEELAKRASQAKGSSGKCVDYVLNIGTQIKSLGIDDEEVLKMAEMVNVKTKQ